MTSLLDRIKSALKSGNTAEAKRLASQVSDDEIEQTRAEIEQTMGEIKDLCKRLRSNGPVEQVQFKPEDFGE